MASNGDFEAVHAIAERIQNSVVCSLARAKAGDIERAAEAIKPAKQGRIHTFMSTSEIHLMHQYRIDQAKCLEMIKDSVELARKHTDNVEWSAMDATRTEQDFLCRAVEVAIKAGATTVNIPDTVGYATTKDYADLIRYILANAEGVEDIIISTHCQNDLGLATANSLAGALAGARQIECTINGIGERAGNASLEEVVMAIKTRKDVFDLECNIDATHIIRASKLVQTITGSAVQVNKAIVGANAFAHESGIHQDGVLKHASTYEIMTPESVGLEKSNLVLGKHSGRAAFRDKLELLGMKIGDNAFEEAFHRFKELADKKKDIFDEDIITLIGDGTDTSDQITFVRMGVHCGSEGPQEARMTIEMNGEAHHVVATGNGPVDAAFNAIKAIVPHSGRLVLYQVNALTAGTDAQGEVMVRLETPEGQVVTGNGTHIDTVVASAMAYVGALNRLKTLESVKKLSLMDDEAA